MDIGPKHYDYYPDGSLSLATDSRSGSSAVTYTYDSSGNMTNRVVTDRDDLIIENYHYTDNRPDNQDFGYDANGNMTFNNLTGHRYHFTPENRMTSAETETGNFSFVYDGEGRRRLKMKRNEAELFFYDATGNNILEKLTFDLSDTDNPKVLKDECFVNLGANNVAQFNYFDPVVSIEFEDLTQSAFYPGDKIVAYVNYDYEGPTQENVWLFVILYVYGECFFYPSWSETADAELITLKNGENNKIKFLNTEPLSSFQTKIEDLYFAAAMATSYIERVPAIFGNLAIKGFSLQPTRPNSYVKPGAQNGKGTLEFPYGDIQTAIDSVEIGETATIKLFP
ncbi:hypothetical protein K8T06_13190, partial [bacterium]|nr:hypothetical protein [bacterium]